MVIVTQYATVADLMARFDARLLGDLASDNATPVVPADLPTNANLLAALADASSDIDAAVRVGNRYTPAQMAALNASSAQLLIRLACDQAIIFLKRRRGKLGEKEKDFAQEVAARMKALRDGENYLMLATQTEAAASVQELAGPCLIPIGSKPLQTMVECTQNYYPQTGRRRPGGCDC